MITLLSPNYVPIPVTEDDMVTATLVWGITIGFGALTTWSGVKQTVGFYQRRKRDTKRLTPYIIMIWLEIVVCCVFSIICWLYLRGLIAPSFAFYFTILTLWALQVQLLLQIIINRVSVLMVDRRRARQLKWGVAILITIINISVYCIWVPARLQISENYIHINNVWDRCEKSIYLVIDALLNIYFIRTVQRSLVQPGLHKYKPLVRFNSLIIILSLGMDVLIISTMSLPNSFVYMQFHPLAYIVKLKIEMSMADLIATVARARDNEEGHNSGNVFLSSSDPAHTTRGDASAFHTKTGASAVVKAFNTMAPGTSGREDASSRGPFGGSRHSHDIELGNIPESPDFKDDGAERGAGGFLVHRQDEVRMEFEHIAQAEDKSERGGSGPYNGAQHGRESDETPFVNQEKSYTKVWGSV